MDRHIRANWLDRLHTDWLNESKVFSIHRDDVQKLFERLQRNKEVSYTTTGNLTAGVRLPDLESSAPTQGECRRFMSDVIDAQQRAVIRAVQDSDFGSVLTKRLIMVSRVLKAAQARVFNNKNYIRKSC